MRKRVKWIGMLVIVTLLMIGGIVYGLIPYSPIPDPQPKSSRMTSQQKQNKVKDKEMPSSPSMHLSQERVNHVLKKYEDRTPTYWGEKVPGVRLRLPTKERVMALTFDACGGAKGSQVDEGLLRYLASEKIPATLFINSRWIDANPKRFRQLAKNPLFEIANHGTEHRPLSVNGRSIYGIKGTKSLKDALDEIVTNQRKIASITGKMPRYFRSGTAYYDDVTVAAAKELGIEVVNFNILGDAGATYNRLQVKEALFHARPGSIVIGHMNHPEGETAEGIRDAVPLLRKKGYRFVKIEDIEKHSEKVH
ncbi:polysaccharide deacetylase family protein [Marininema halotolerans]|uniref:Peptidoglycan/xylan/chitin deacetylase, PgdA/CDA1 family n=1 Tax=Marininema halotolerans TaxID=1155944 RepID=A0A1I6QMP6_9BACL|nr:polysaccharide deacetylase family protein [Marininema halotolerans]SFS53598.1 Peptidoglycan/xylan/chitin deacetylase, PgdA/CDA1 family [Marininema halotolerans]